MFGKRFRDSNDSHEQSEQPKRVYPEKSASQTRNAGSKHNQSFREVKGFINEIGNQRNVAELFERFDARDDSSESEETANSFGCS